MAARHNQRHSSYYEAILQVRASPREAGDVLHSVVEKVKAKGQEDIFISKKKKVTNGIDIYLSSNRFAVEAGRELFRAMGGELKVSRKLFSQHRQTSRVLYRVTVLFRAAPFKAGDFVLFEGKAFRVSSIGRLVVVEGVENSRLFELAYRDAVRNFEKLSPVKAVVSKVQPYLEIIHPETFQSVPVLPVTKGSKLVPGEKIKVIAAEGKVWGAK
ncbi:hypothetical protein HYU17_01095 [Candidatus Woesearchaeota archaeon]|nr:hypothetical protein [Candidatus Woesearchaeota archaeon]